MPFNHFHSIHSQERFGWERPGWFSTKSSIPVEKYDWYGAYDTPLNPNDVYKTNLNLDYTFDYPSIHENVSRVLIILTKKNQYVENMVQTSCSKI